MKDLINTNICSVFLVDTSRVDSNFPDVSVFEANPKRFMHESFFCSLKDSRYSKYPTAFRLKISCRFVAMAPKKKYMTGVAPGMPGASTQPLAPGASTRREDGTWKTTKELVDELTDADAKKARGLAAPPSRQSLTASASQQVAQPLVNTKIRKNSIQHTNQNVQTKSLKQ